MPNAKTTMAYTVKKLAAASGVSVRTLHFYDEVDLLKPAFVAANGYRFYQEAQLLRLQQILFFRELGFELKAIKRVLGRRDFERVTALETHRKALQKKVARTQQLIATIDKTIEHLKGIKKMKTEEMFEGFNPEVQAKHEEYLVKRYGPEMKKGIAESKKRVKHWTKADWEKSGAAFNAICADLVAALEKKLPAGSTAVQDAVRRHFEWLKQFWTPNRESYIGHGALITDSDFRKAYEKHHPELPAFMAGAMTIFANKELT